LNNLDKIKDMRVLKPDTEIEKLHFENTFFLTSKFYDKKKYFSIMWGGVGIRDGVYVLKKSIEIVKSGEYSLPFFRERVLYNSSDSAPEFWKDLYWLNCYEDRKNAIEANMIDDQRRFDNNPYKNDILLKKDYEEELQGSKEELNELNEVIELSKEFRSLINEALPNLENEFAQQLQRHEKEIERKWEVKKLKEERISTKNSISPQQTNIETLPPQPNAKTKTELPETLSDLITHEKSNEIVKGIKIQYKNIKGKELKILFKALQDLQLLPPGRIGAKFYRCFKNTFDWDIGTPQAVNDYKFKSGILNHKEIYTQSDDEKELVKMKAFLSEIINDK
jgi:hypothetical protein